ncbi:MAG: hypothetical protein JWM34_1877 [Ilumatobacteraceae bacterium]|nr:hypothetical protein [Ilumatobacteraceae bacterium]
MRTCGTVHSVGGRDADDHLCWGYADQHQFGAAVAEFLADGLAAGQRIAYFGTSIEAQREHLRALGDLDGLINVGALVLDSILDMYAGEKAIDAAEQVRQYARATAAAIDAGFTGLRVAADMTTLVTTAAQRDAFARYEHLMDRYMAEGHSFTAMCAYDTGRLAPREAAELACMHPLSNSEDIPFRLYAPDAHADLAIAGEIDAFGDELFRQALERVSPPPLDDVWIIDAVGVTFGDHRMLRAIDQRAAAHGAIAVLQVTGGTAATLVELLDLRNIRIVEWSA